MNLRLNVLTEEHPKAACKIIKLSRGKRTSYMAIQMVLQEDCSDCGENILLMSVNYLY